MKNPFPHRLMAAGAAAVLLLAAPTGCVVNPQEQQMIMAQQREDALLIQEEFRRLRGRIDALEMEVARMNQQVIGAGAEQTRATQAQLSGLNATIDELQRRIRAVDAAREADKKEIVDSLSKRMAGLMASAPRSGGSSGGSRRAISNEGYEHTVASGETLSAIAKAYGARTDDIIQANNLQSADMLRVGQKLFIPAP